MTKNITIIGLGLSGLNCARVLSESSDYNVTVFDKGIEVGGRV